MAIVVGTNSYASVAEADTYWAERGNATWTADTTDNKEIALIKATDYIEQTFVFIGDKATSIQRLSWPRVNAYVDRYLLESTNIPERIKEAAIQLAETYRAGAVALEDIVTETSSVQKEKVGPIEVQYFNNRPTNPVPTKTHKMLREYTIKGRLLRV